MLPMMLVASAAATGSIRPVVHRRAAGKRGNRGSTMSMAASAAGYSVKQLAWYRGVITSEG